MRTKILSIFWILFLGCEHQKICVKPNIFQGWESLKQENMIIQKNDFSCGAAALATLMLYFGDQVSEHDLLVDIFQPLNKNEVKERKKDGLSLLDLKRVALQKGYKVLGVKLTYAQLSKIPCPILVYLEIEEYKHFAVFKGIQGCEVFLADPLYGNSKIHISQFVKNWKGNLALILYKTERTPNYSAFDLHPEIYFVRQIFLRSPFLLPVSNYAIIAHPPKL